MTIYLDLLSPIDSCGGRKQTQGLEHFPFSPFRLAPDGVYHASPSPESGPPVAGLFTFGLPDLPFCGISSIL